MSYQLGVDIGTTYTAAAVARDGRAEPVQLGNRSPLIPTIVFLRPDGRLLVGEAAERRAIAEPERLAREFKRRVGDSVPILLGGTPYSAQALMAVVLDWVISRTAELEGGPAERVIVTHPANWGEFKRESLAAAARSAGLTVELMTEPESAALHFASGDRIAAARTIAVYDLGGGTFDAAVLRKGTDRFEVLGSPEGIENLGGMDFDEAVLDHVRKAVGAALQSAERDPAAELARAAELRRQAIEAKEALSEDIDASIPVTLPDGRREVLLHRTELEDMIRPAIELTVHCLDRVIRQAAEEEVDAVILVGGSSRIPLIRQLVGTTLQRPVELDNQPQLAVALGAALAASERSATATAAGAQPPLPEPAEPGEPEPAAIARRSFVADLPTRLARTPRGILAASAAAVLALILLAVGLAANDGERVPTGQHSSIPNPTLAAAAPSTTAAAPSATARKSTASARANSPRAAPSTTSSASGTGEPSGSSPGPAQTPKATEKAPPSPGRTIRSGKAQTIDLFGLAPDADWRTGAGTVPFPAPSGDSRGGAVIFPAGTWLLEDGTSPRFMVTHPEWVDNGWIEGDFQLPKAIIAGDRFRATVGFQQAQSGNVGAATFIVQAVFDDRSVSGSLVRRFDSQADGVMHQLDVDLSAVRGARTLRLRVEAGPTAAQDWAAWVKPRIEG